MNKKKYYKILFISGAFFNWIVSISFFLLSILLYPEIFALFGSEAPPTLFFLHSLLGLIFVYGIGYFIVGMDLTKNKGAAILGVISKLSFFTFCLTYFLLGDLYFIIVLLGSLDFVYAILFVEYLLRYKRE